MINEKLLSSFQFIFQASSQLRIVPFTYYAKARTWSVRSNKLELLVSHFVAAILCFRLAYVTAAVLTSDFSADSLHEDYLLALQLTMFINGAGFQITLWRKTGDLTWLFNQMNSVNKV